MTDTQILACALPGKSGQRRTGSNAGYRAHQKAGERPCEPCKAARRAYAAGYYETNREERNEKSKAYHWANRDRMNQVSRDYYAANREEVRQSQREWRQLNRDVVRTLKVEYSRSRNARIRETSGGAIDRVAIAERDQWTCQWCHEPVGPEVEYPDPMSMSLDHRTPLAAGGQHVESNLQLMHWYCNVLKGTTTEAVG